MRVINDNQSIFALISELYHCLFLCMLLRCFKHPPRQKSVDSHLQEPQAQYAWTALGNMVPHNVYLQQTANLSSRFLKSESMGSLLRQILLREDTEVV